VLVEDDEWQSRTKENTLHSPFTHEKDVLERRKGTVQRAACCSLLFLHIIDSRSEIEMKLFMNLVLILTEIMLLDYIFSKFRSRCVSMQICKFHIGLILSLSCACMNNA
jgi:hypothetical protein